MSKLIIFAPQCGGNHLANMIGASQNLDNCLNLQEIELAYQNDKNASHTHMNEFFINEMISYTVTIKNNSIYVGHLDEVWNNWDRLKDKIKDVLVIDLSKKAQETIRKNKITYLESCSYTKEFIEKLFPNWNVESIHLDDLFGNADMLKFILDGTSFSLDNRCVKLHNIWLKKIKDSK